jgi:hypothetical protein
MSEAKGKLPVMSDHHIPVVPTLNELEQTIRQSWAADTSDDPDEWSPSNPARGQCGVTALTLRDLLGGDILIADVFRHGNAVERHAWNRLASGLEIDLTREQFRNGETLGPPNVAEPFAGRNRYQLLASRVSTELAKTATASPGSRTQGPS